MNERTITLYEGEEQEVVLPARFEVCPICEGRGTHDHPAFANGITSSEWNGPDWDDDDRASYLRGEYDVQCAECAGKRVVLVLDEARCTSAQIAVYREFEREEADYRSICAMERRYGA